jgi:hypothetical protein
MADNSSSLVFWGGLMLVLIGMWLWDSADDIIHSKFRYSIEYTTDEANVFNSPKPHDCAFWGAPIGKKWCHYDRTVEDHQVPALITSNDTNTTAPFGQTTGEKRGTGTMARMVPRSLHPIRPKLTSMWVGLRWKLSDRQPSTVANEGFRLIPTEAVG